MLSQDTSLNNSVIAVFKRVGETPKEALERLRNARPELRDVTLSYAGRLDPLAEGVLVVLVGEANKRRDEYLGLEKTYHVDVLFGFETDTYDPLGLVDGGFDRSLKLSRDTITRIAGSYVGTFEQAYPPYSSKPVDGKPLFQWSREGVLKDLPTRSVSIRSCIVHSFDHVRSEIVKDSVMEKIALVKGDFRQREIMNRWADVFTTIGPDTKIPIARFEVSASSGTYMRGLAHHVGQECATRALALHILRTRVGKMTLSDTVM